LVGLASSSVHGCLLPELVIDTTPGSGGSSPDGEGAMGGDAGGGSPAETSGGQASTGGTDGGSGGSSAGGSSSGGSGATGGEGTGGEGTGGEGTGATSAGCGTPATLISGAATIDIDGTTRDYVLDIPVSYAPSSAYGLVFAFHGFSSTGAEVAEGTDIGGPYFGLRALASDTMIFVAPTGLDAWANASGRDLAFVQGVLEHLGTRLCIDESRIFAVGFAAGGAMASAVGCDLASTFRAVAPISGRLLTACDVPPEVPVALWTTHGEADDIIPPEDGEEVVDLFHTGNHCGPTSAAVQPSPPCLAYDGCDAGYPVHYCWWEGGHEVPPFAGQAIWDFFAPL
jgi:polyhydroxybutyrate depolymerase